MKEEAPLRLLNGDELEYFYRLGRPRGAEETPAEAEGEAPLAARGQGRATADATTESFGSAARTSEVGPPASSGEPFAKASGKRKRKSLASSAVVAAACCAVLAFVAYLLLSPRSGSSVKGGVQASFAVKAGESVPDFRGFALEPGGRGPSVARGDLVGQETLLLVWRSSDPEAAAYLRELSQLRDLVLKDEKRATLFLGLCLDTDPVPALALVAATASHRWLHLHDWDPRLPEAHRPSLSLGVIESPALYLIDQRVRLIQAGLGLETARRHFRAP